MTSGRPIVPPLAMVLARASCLLWLFGNLAFGAETVKLNLADGFDFPVGKPDAGNYYKARGLRLRAPRHFGEDWNGRGGGDSDLGDPVYSIGEGIVTWAHDVKGGWGNVVIIRHAYRDSTTGEVKFVDSLYGHLQRMVVRVGEKLKRGEQVGTIGNNRGMYPAHLHFEIRHNLTIGMQRNDIPATLEHWADPTQFINQRRKLNREWRAIEAPIGTYADYKGFKGL